MGYTHHKVVENSETTIYERIDQGLFGLGILANAYKDYVAVDNQTLTAISGSTVGEARAKLEHLATKQQSAAQTSRRPRFWRAGQSLKLLRST